MTERLIVAYILMGMLAVGFCILIWSIWYHSSSQKDARYREESKRRTDEHAKRFGYGESGR